MLKKRNRLTKGIGGGAKLFSSPAFNIKISENKEDMVRFGFVVSKKINKSAVIRNKTKRVLRDSAKDILAKIVPGKNILIISKKELGFEEKEDVLKSMREIFKKASILK